jgi:hypothetical protein
MRKRTVTGVVLAMVGLVGCSKDPLDYNTAMMLVKEKNIDPIKITFNASPDLGNDNLKQAYDRLIEAHLIECKQAQPVGTICQPGSAGDDVAQEGDVNLSIVAGHWVPSLISNIRRSAGDSATADVRLQFEPSLLYNEFRTTFDAVKNASDSRLAEITQTQGKTAHVTFQHSEDGWHLDRLDM